MTGSIFGVGPAHTNGTKLYWRPGAATKSENGRGELARRVDQAPDWLAGGAKCLDADPDQFHPVGYAKAEQDQVRRTITGYCRPCPMAEACLAWGAKHGRGTGIWGGVWLDAPAEWKRRAS